jgi:hypothetical protein
VNTVLRDLTEQFAGHFKDEEAVPGDLPEKYGGLFWEMEAVPGNLDQLMRS